MDDKERKDEYLKLMAEIAYLAFAVNVFTDYCVFFDYSGHVENVRIDIAKSKVDYSDTILSTTFYTKYEDKEYSFREFNITHLMVKRDHLLYILENHDLPYHDLTPVHHMTTTYDF